VVVGERATGEREAVHDRQRIVRRRTHPRKQRNLEAARLVAVAHVRGKAERFDEARRVRVLYETQHQP
jgi:hypothetical protein